MDRDEVLSIIDEARDNKEDPRLVRADLQGMDLQDANLRNIDLKDASLNHATWYGLRIDSLPPEQFTLIPTPHGWDLRLEDWNWFNTPDQLREFITNPDKWPILMKDDLEYCRPYMETTLALCDIHMNNHADYIEKLKGKWVA